MLKNFSPELIISFYFTKKYKNITTTNEQKTKIFIFFQRNPNP